MHQIGRAARAQRRAANAALKAVVDYKTGILCKPWYFGDGDIHIPNNYDNTVTPDGDKFKLIPGEECFARAIPREPPMTAASARLLASTNPNDFRVIQLIKSSSRATAARAGLPRPQ